tara:strand:+ start:285 stop:854 length:570 start_codon:yes stop_codon:yes gene_type:complete
MILMIDNYDSFTYNLVDYLNKLTSLPVEVYRNDNISIQTIISMSPDYIVISPGPKTPTEAGISKEVISYFTGTIPILGVCLGHQSIGEVFGGKTVHAKRLMHGKISNIKHTGHSLFNNISSPFPATRYHSLVIEQQSFPEQLDIIARSIDDDEIMAVCHKTHPTYGVQFHPESICSPDGLKLLDNFLAL